MQKLFDVGSDNWLRFKDENGNEYSDYLEKKYFSIFEFITVLKNQYPNGKLCYN